jgi:thiamine-monophosphate kinase
MKEHEVIDRLRRAFPDSGIGDDTAVLPCIAAGCGRGPDLLFASDAIVEGVHFRRETSTLSQAIQKLVTSNVSDIYAMGGNPEAIVLSAALAPGTTGDDLDQIIDGLKKACGAYGVRLAGGDTVSSTGGFFFDVAIVGTVSHGRAVMRSGARPGDGIVLFGEIGASLAGLSILTALGGKRAGAKGAGMKVPVPTPAIRRALDGERGLREAFAGLALTTTERGLARTAGRFKRIPCGAAILRCVKQHLVPLASPLAASLLKGSPTNITSMIDVSDGLAKDLRTLCAESGVGAVIYEEALPVAAGVSEMFGLEGRALANFAISSGEEYVLLATARAGGTRARKGQTARRPGAPDFDLSVAAQSHGGRAIGRVVAAKDGITLVDAGGKRRPLPALGYEHIF